MKKYVVLLMLISIKLSAFAQESYPKITGYVGLVHPIVTFTSESTTFNFDGHYVVGVPVGLNLWKSKKIGFSFELVPYVRAENGSSKMSNLLIHPGVLLSLGSGFTFVGRLAFETSGRYGFTPGINKVIINNKASKIFVVLPVPVRFGNDKPSSATIAFQVGLAF